MTASTTFRDSEVHFKPFLLIIFICVPVWLSVGTHMSGHYMCESEHAWKSENNFSRVSFPLPLWESSELYWNTSTCWVASASSISDGFYVPSVECQLLYIQNTLKICKPFGCTTKAKTRTSRRSLSHENFLTWKNTLGMDMQESFCPSSHVCWADLHSLFKNWCLAVESDWTQVTSLWD